MKKILVAFLVMLMVIGMLAPQVMAQGELDTIYGAKNHLEMFEAMKSISGLSEQVKKVEALTSEQRNNILTGLFIRRKNPQNLDEFKTFFEEKYKGATTYMAFEPGYPKVQDNDEHGATMTVLTNETGYVYIVAFPDGAEGGINDIKQLMEYYKADNNLYKKRVFVQAGIETTFPISCATYGSGGKYRAYFCLRTEHNCFSEFRQINYKVKKIVMPEPLTLILYRVGDYWMTPNGRVVFLSIDVMSNMEYDYWECLHFAYVNDHTYNSGGPYMVFDSYDQVNTYQPFDSLCLTWRFPRYYSVNRFYLSNGETYDNIMFVEFENGNVNVETINIV